MEILIPDNWLRDLLKTKATPAQIAKYLSHCGPSIEKVEKKDGDYVYTVDVTTNRVDTACVYGISREAAAILPQFGIKAALLPLKLKKPRTQGSLSLKIKTSEKLTKRVMAVVLENIENWTTPEWMKKRLEATGIRSLNAVVDITNYVMTEIGHPTHVFDYDLITTRSLVFRESDKGEKIVSLDEKEYSLPGGDIVIDNGEGEIIDLPGIIGTKNSVVNQNSKRIIFFIDNNDPVKIRRTSMGLGIRTVAATLNEKGVDPELAEVALLRGIQLYSEVCQAKVASKIHDIYQKPYLEKKIKVSKTFIDQRLGINIKKEEIKSSLDALGFKASWNKDALTSIIPSYRANDIGIPEDIVEEVARIYGYHNLPSTIMEGKIPERLSEAPFDFEIKIKNILKGYGAVEVYTSSLVSEESVYPKFALRMKNPLGKDAEYLRMSLAPSLVYASIVNSGSKEPFHLFEMANVYIARQGDLPEESMMLAGIFYDHSFRQAKGIVEAVLIELNIDVSETPEDFINFKASSRLVFKSKKLEVGQFGVLEAGQIYYEFEIEKLRKAASQFPSYKPIPKYPAQIEDVTLTFPARTKIGEVLEAIKSSDKFIYNVELTDIFKEAYTFRIWYQHPTKTLDNQEVEGIRSKVLEVLKKKFGASIKE